MSVGMDTEIDMDDEVRDDASPEGHDSASTEGRDDKDDVADDASTEGCGDKDVPSRDGRDAEVRGLVAAALEGRLGDAQAQRLAALTAGNETLLMLVFLAAARRIDEQNGRAVEQSKQLDEQNKQLVEMNQRVAELNTTIAQQNARLAALGGQLVLAGPTCPSTPSGQKPIYIKPPAKARKGKPGAKAGHEGTRRPAPPEIDHRKEHRLDVCPDCGKKLQHGKRIRTRTIEDILSDLRSNVTEHTIHRDYCPACKKTVEPKVPDALPNATIGNNLVALTSWLHYGVGVTISQVRQLVDIHLRTRISDGGLVSCWHRLGEILTPWYEQIADSARSSAVLHADETGWRVNGKTHWLWCFASKDACYYIIDPSRGRDVVERFFVEAFDGVLVHDFWAAYNHVLADDHQCCLAHLLREVEKVNLTNSSADWKAFAKKLRRLIRDAIRLRKRADFTPARYGPLIRRIDRRLMTLARDALAESAPGHDACATGDACASHNTCASRVANITRDANITRGTNIVRDADVVRLSKRLLKYCDSLFTFLDRPEVPYDNNHGERSIRPAVIIRKNSQSNRSDKGATTQAVLMSVYRTLKLRGQNPLATITTALATYLTTNQLPPLPTQLVADG